MLDTQVLLWWLDDPGSLAASAGRLISVSAAVAWEITIKRRFGKLEAPDDLENVLEEERFQHLPDHGSPCAGGGRVAGDATPSTASP